MREEYRRQAICNKSHRLHFVGSPFTIVVVDFNVIRASRGTGSMKHSLIQSITLFGTVAAMLTLTVVVTLFAW